MNFFKIISRHYLLAVFGVAMAGMVSIPAHPAAAQEKCTVDYETILTLRGPRFGFPAVWDATYNPRDEMAQLAASLPLKGGTVLSLGRVLDAEKMAPTHIALVELNRRGRVLDEKRTPARTDEEPLRILPMGDGYVALSDFREGRRRQVRLSWFREDRSFRYDRVLRHDDYDYEAQDIVPAIDGSGLIAVLEAIPVNDGSKNPHAVLVRLNSVGDEQWRRAYNFGPATKITSLTPIDESNYIAVGRIEDDEGIPGGWAMKLGHDGTLHWQRAYPRGAAAILQNAAMLPALSVTGGFVFSGDIRPVNGAPQGAWIMAVDGLGNPLWQTYFRRDDTGFAAPFVQVMDDGRISVLLNARAGPDADATAMRSHIRLLTLSPRGWIMQDEAYVNGLQARATDLISGLNGERIVTAIIESDARPTPPDVMNAHLGEGDTGAEETTGKPAYEGWVFVGTALDPWQDHCRARTAR